MGDRTGLEGHSGGIGSFFVDGKCPICGKAIPRPPRGSFPRASHLRMHVREGTVKEEPRGHYTVVTNG